MSAEQVGSPPITGLEMTDLLRAVIEVSRDALVVLDDQGVLLAASSATAALFRYSPSELNASPLSMLLPEWKVHETTATREPVRMAGVTHGGEKLQVDLSLGTVTADGRPLRVGCIRDVRVDQEADMLRRLLAKRASLQSDIGMALAQARTPRAMLQRCVEVLVRHLDAAFARIWTVNDEGTVLELQASAGQYTHLDGPHGRVPVGQFKIGLIAQQRTSVVTNDVVNDPRISDREWARREGMIGFAGHPLIVDGRVVGVMALFSRHPLTELTLGDLATIADAIAQGLERLRAEAEMHAMQAELMRVSRIVTMGELMASVVHEVNQPLTSLVTNAAACRLLLNQDTPRLDEIRLAVEDIATSGRRANNVVRRIYTLLEKGQPQIADLEINAIIGEILELVRNELRKRRVALVTHLAPGLPRVRSDRVQLQQVMLNLITNAVEAMAGVGEHNRQLTITSGFDGREYVSVEVTDTGIGIDPRHLPRVCDPFFTTKADGMGMGLSICRTIVGRAGGELLVRPGVQGGATVSFTLPVSPSHEAATAPGHDPAGPPRH